MCAHNCNHQKLCIAETILGKVMYCPIWIRLALESWRYLFSSRILCSPFTMKITYLNMLWRSALISCPENSKLKNMSTKTSLQSGLLAQKDSFTPCLGVLIAFIANVAGDTFLIGYMGMGLVGAAWATVISQWAGCIVTLMCLPGKNRVFISHSL